MHLLAATPGAANDGSEAVDLGQTPADVIFLTAADTELTALAAARRRLGGAAPTLRLANLLHLSHPMSVDLYVETVVQHARLVVVRLLGGESYWPYGVEQITGICREKNIDLIMVPGDDQPDPALMRYSTCPEQTVHRMWQYCVHGGPDNSLALLQFAAHLLGAEDTARLPAPLPAAGLYWPAQLAAERGGPVFLTDIKSQWRPNMPVAAVVFYRALWQSGSLAPVDALIAELQAVGLNALPIFVSSLKQAAAAETVASLLAQSPPGIIVNLTGFAVSTPGARDLEGPLADSDVPVLQAVLAAGSETDWRENPQGLTARDIAMNIALPEVDGRIMTRAIAFKTERQFDPETECALVSHEPLTDRVRWCAALAKSWTDLRRKPASARRVAIVLANYPNRDGRLGNGVGLDTPQGTIVLLQAMAAAGYAVQDCPATGDDLIARLRKGPTNAADAARHRRGGVALALADYNTAFQALPGPVRERVTDRWGAPEADPFFVDGHFHLAAFHLGNVVIGLQPARGYQIDPVQSYHDPDLVPPHGYFAFYIWLRRSAAVDAVVHMGKHGNLEWLPGKAVGLSDTCFPEAVFWPVPHLYPFIVNDPGEGTQAKRRSAAVIIDHLTPPLTRAESYGALADLERLVDEYYDAAHVDPRRTRLLAADILDLSARIGLDADCGIEGVDDENTRLNKLDNYLCELKELQIRDGLHIFGQSPDGRQRRDLLIALTRLSRGTERPGDASLLQALAADLDLQDADGNHFDPLDCRFGDPWTGGKPHALVACLTAPWRSIGDTVERLEQLAADLLDAALIPDPSWTQTDAVLQEIQNTIAGWVDCSGEREIGSMLKALDGGPVPPGPAGAPTRARLDVLPTGRNFYSVDTRMVPTPTAWRLGWASADLLLARYRQDHGAWPKSLIVSAWGTANMRTGGDDLAQALALMGVRPRWQGASGRVVGFEILPLELLDRPRVDVTLRISGFFRDAFPAQIALFDSAVRDVAALDEPPEKNPLAARVKAAQTRFQCAGAAPEQAWHNAAYRVFGAKPGAYGAGLQALIDEKGWQDDSDLANAYVAWGGYAYGAVAPGTAASASAGGSWGVPAHRLFEERLAATDGVVHNQDNREHDLLDSDDYYQFEGGATAAVRHFSGKQPAVYHNDHSRPDNLKIRALDEEIARIVRARVVNPKWLRGVMRHGYKGAFEIAATVDYLFAFAATAHAVRDHHFDAVMEAYLEDADVRAFLLAKNPDAAHDIAARLGEAIDRGLWRPKRNRIEESLEEFKSSAQLSILNKGDA